MNGPYPSKEELNDLLMEDALELPLVSLHEGADPQDDMVLVPSRRLRASVAQMVDFIKSSHSQWTAKVMKMRQVSLCCDFQTSSKQKKRLSFIHYK